MEKAQCGRISGKLGPLYTLDPAGRRRIVRILACVKACRIVGLYVVVHDAIVTVLVDALRYLYVSGTVQVMSSLTTLLTLALKAGGGGKIARATSTYIQQPPEARPCWGLCALASVWHGVPQAARFAAHVIAPPAPVFRSAGGNVRAVAEKRCHVLTAHVGQAGVLGALFGVGWEKVAVKAVGEE